MQESPTAKEAALLNVGIALSLFWGFQIAAQGQGSPPGFMPPPPHVNAPLGRIKRYPGDREGAFETGRYRDLLRSWATRPQRPERRSTRYSSNSSTGMRSRSGCISRPAPTQYEFDALWNWSNTYILITDSKNPNVGYFARSMNTDGTPRSSFFNTPRAWMNKLR
jgi:oligosaccharide reducing-end xylanase